jgi:uncharacterized protein YbaP (TraB family)
MFCKTSIRTSKIFVAIIIVLVASCKTSQKTTEQAAISLDPPLDNEKTLLWQVSGNDITQTSYLFGTIHVIPSEDFNLEDNVLSKLSKTKQLVLELDLGNINTLEVARAALLPDNKTVKDYLTEDDYMLLESYFADYLNAPMPLFKTAYAKLKPFFLQQMIYIKYLGNNTSSYEMELMDKARDSNAEIIGLETLNEQLSFIDKISLEDQFESLIKTIQEGDEQAKYLDTLIEAYKDKDLPRLNEMINSYDEFKDISNTLIDERNINWVIKLKPILQKGAAFIGVGAGHLGGQMGLIQLLRNEGYTVDPISMD